MAERSKEEEKERPTPAVLAPDTVPGSNKTVYLSPKETSIFIQLYSKLKPQKYRPNVQTRKENGKIARKGEKRLSSAKVTKLCYSSKSPHDESVPHLFLRHWYTHKQPMQSRFQIFCSVWT